MNIEDILNKAKNENTLTSKIALKVELNKIDRRANDLVDQFFDFISNELNYIDGLSYGPINKPRFSETEKEALIKKLKEVAKEVPNKLENSIKDVFDIASTDDEKKEDRSEEPKEVEIEIEKPVAIANPPLTMSHFGY